MNCNNQEVFCLVDSCLLLLSHDLSCITVCEVTCPIVKVVCITGKTVVDNSQETSMLWGLHRVTKQTHPLWTLTPVELCKLSLLSLCQHKLWPSCPPSLHVSLFPSFSQRSCSPRIMWPVCVTYIMWLNSKPGSEKAAWVSYDELPFTTDGEFRLRDSHWGSWLQFLFSVTPLKSFSPFCTSVQMLTHTSASAEQLSHHIWHIQAEICHISEITSCFTKWCITFTVITIKFYCPDSLYIHSCSSLKWTLLYTVTDWMQADQSAVILWRPCHHLSQSCVKFRSGAEQMLEWNSSEIHCNMKQWKVMKSLKHEPSGFSFNWDQTREKKLHLTEDEQLSP